MLSTDTESQDAQDNKPVSSDLIRKTLADSALQRVTISTVHAAKGLEWPVVFVPCGKSERVLRIRLC